MNKMNANIFKVLLVIILGLTIQNSFGQSADTTKMSSLIVYGDGFMFSVKEPDGWNGDTDKAAEYYANVIFYKSKAELENGGALIQVYNYKKLNEEIEKDLTYDVNRYKKDYKDLLKEQTLIIEHKDYKCFAKLVYVLDKIYKYIVYLNPGKKFKNGISVAMNISDRPATEDELHAFREIVASLIMMKG